MDFFSHISCHILEEFWCLKNKKSHQKNSEWTTVIQSSWRQASFRMRHGTKLANTEKLQNRQCSLWTARKSARAWATHLSSWVLLMVICVAVVAPFILFFWVNVTPESITTDAQVSISRGWNGRSSKAARRIYSAVASAQVWTKASESLWCFKCESKRVSNLKSVLQWHQQQRRLSKVNNRVKIKRVGANSKPRWYTCVVQVRVAAHEKRVEPRLAAA